MKINKPKYELILAEKGWTNQTARHHADLSTATFCKAINGSDVRPITVRKIADALGVSPADIAEGG